jgi:hypothetical protein
MKNKLRFRILLGGAILTLIALLASSQGVRPAEAQTGGGYDLTWNAIAGGGATPPGSAGGAYSLSGTIGQADAGTLSGGNYTLNGGFWVAFLGNRIELPLIMR